MPAWLSDSIAWWSSLYGNHASVALIVTFLHVAGVVVGGGTALTLDRRILRGRRDGPDDRRLSLKMLADAHTPVIATLTVTVVTGLLLVLSDTETFIGSGVFWTKMALFVLLAANGALVMFARKAVSRTDGAAGWTLLAFAATASAVLWMSVLLFGEWLRVAA